ncbi:MAG: hypothetical protein GY788_30565, partial [bacterium]|nr:hypothetical protein [bacterium]
DQSQIDKEKLELRARLETINKQTQRVAVDLELATDVAQRIVDELRRERNIVQHRLTTLAAHPDISDLNQADLAPIAQRITARVTQDTPEMMKEAFDLLDLQATVQGVHNGKVLLQGTAALPHGPAFDGKVSTGMPQLP